MVCLVSESPETATVVGLDWPRPGGAFFRLFRAHKGASSFPENRIGKRVGSGQMKKPPSEIKNRGVCPLAGGSARANEAMTFPWGKLSTTGAAGGTNFSDPSCGHGAEKKHKLLPLDTAPPFSPQPPHAAGLLHSPAHEARTGSSDPPLPQEQRCATSVAASSPKERPRRGYPPAGASQVRPAEGHPLDAVGNRGSRLWRIKSRRANPAGPIRGR
jgi:hypothetical protein